MTDIFAPRRPPIDVAKLGAAWKAIATSASQPAVPIILDTDIGTDVDDAIAMTFALRRPELDVRAITTSRGEVHKRAAIVSRMLSVLRRTDIPYAPGSPVMFNGQTRRDKPVNQYAFAGDESNRPTPSSNDAQSLLRDTIRAHPGEMWLVVIGTMTNAALLIRDDPETARLLKGIVCMGGEPTRPYPEANIKHDPEAAAFVCRSGLLRFVGTYDVTVRMLIPQTDEQRLARIDAPHTRALLELIGLWRREHAHKPGPVAFDVCPLAWLFAPDFFTTEPMGLDVALEPDDRRAIIFPSPDAPPCEVTTDINAVALHRMLIDTLTSGTSESP